MFRFKVALDEANLVGQRRDCGGDRVTIGKEA
jgi:hypothetical protein